MQTHPNAEFRALIVPSLFVCVIFLLLLFRSDAMSTLREEATLSIEVRSKHSKLQNPQ